MAGPWTTADDVIESWIGSGAPTDDVLVDVWIGRAERVLKSRVPSLQERIEANEPDLLERVQDVVCAMVQRVFRNPEGIRQRNETTGPFTESSTYGGDLPGGLAATDDELASLAPGLKVGGAYEIDPLADYVAPWGL